MSRIPTYIPVPKSEGKKLGKNEPTIIIAVKSDTRAAAISNGFYMHCLYGCIPRIHVYILYMCISICIYSLSFSKVIPSSLKARTLITFISLAFTIYQKNIFFKLIINYSEFPTYFSVFTYQIFKLIKIYSKLRKSTVSDR